MSGARALFADFTRRIDDYRQTRDFPAVEGVSRLSAHLRFGTISVRKLAAFASAHGGAGAEIWLGELIWRDFYQMILWHHPHVVDACFKPACDRIEWDEAPERFAAWCEGRTGYPIVDAAMRQLNSTGYLHNRLRMIAASFLTKDLGIDWRRGERYFADRLTDYDLAANNGGWQWAASTSPAAGLRRACGARRCSPAAVRAVPLPRRACRGSGRRRVSVRTRDACRPAGR
jgi:deoxyribodipyrimidine photo-lyase